MSPKKIRPGVGRIEFTGLRFFLEKMDGRMSRKEVVELVREFFSSRGLYLESLKVEFRMTCRPTSIVDGKRTPILGLMHPRENRVEVFLSTTPWWRVREVIFHELDHVAWENEGGRFNSPLPYSQKPYEKRANKIGIKHAARAAL